MAKTTTKRLFDNPTEDKQHPITREGGSGVQKIYHFPNGYGASVVRFKTVGFFTPSMYGSYTDNEKEWELAILSKDTRGNWSLDYTTPISDDVMGHLSEAEVEKILKKIKALK